MHLHRQHVRPLHDQARIDRWQYVRLLFRFADVACRRRVIDHVSGRHPHAPDFLTVQVIHRAVVHDVVQRQFQSLVRAVEDKLLPQINRPHARAHRRANPRRGQRRRAKAKHPRAHRPRTIVELRVPPLWIGRARLGEITPRIAVIDQHHALARNHLGTRHRNLQLARRVRARRAARPRTHGPIPPVIHRLVRADQHQRMPGASGRRRPFPAVAVAHLADDQPVLVAQPDAVAGLARRPTHGPYTRTVFGIL